MYILIRWMLWLFFLFLQIIMVFSKPRIAEELNSSTFVPFTNHCFFIYLFKGISFMVSTICLYAICLYAIKLQNLGTNALHQVTRFK